MFFNLFVIPMLATLAFIVVLYPCAVKIGFTDKPCHRKQHKKPTPLIGGIAIYLAILGTLLFNVNPLPHQTAFISAVTLLVFVGLIDDYKSLGFKIRMIVQIVAGLIMTEYADIKIDNLGNLFGFGEIHLGTYATAFTVFCVVGGINAFNMIDGIDGLAGSLILVSISSIAIMSWISHNYIIFSYCLIFAASILAFLLFNLPIFGRPNAKIFLGDTGSTLLGFGACWLAIDASQGENNLITPSTVLWILALPLFDSVCVMIRRIGKGRSPFNPDREHLHHIFTVAGYNNKLTLTLLLFISLSLSITGITASHNFGVPESVLFWSFMFIFAAHFWMMHNAWKIVKISRYLRVTKVFDRRVENHRRAEDQRSESDRRYIPSELELKKFHRANGGFMASLLSQRLRRNNAIDRRAVRNIFADSQQGLVNRRSMGDRRNIPTEKEQVSNDKKNENIKYSDPS